MSTKGSYLFSILVGLVVLGLAPTPAAACSCMEQPFETARANAAAIFEARVESIETEGGRSRVRMNVTQTWVEAGHEHVDVVTAESSAACGFTFEVGQVYLVYASAVEDGAYRVSLCSRTQLMASADDDRALLGSGVVPVDIEDAPEDDTPTVTTPPSRGGCASCSVGRADGYGWLAMLAALALMISRRSMRDRS